MIRENQIAFACGMKGSGKSYWLREKFVLHAPRVIHIDPNGDYLDDPAVLIVDGYEGLLKALHAFAAANVREWRVAVSIDDPDEIAELFQLLAPPQNFGRGSLARAFGGIGIESGECDVIAPNGRTSPIVQGGWRRGRHMRLDLFMGTQRPAACDRLISAMADIVACFALDEPRDVDWVRDKLGKAAADRVVSLPDHWHLEKHRGERDILVVDPRGRVTERFAAVGLERAVHAVARSSDDAAREKKPPRRYTRP